jgi:SNF2 family DNA or RNA helicase|tara:strand:+ start:4221 stop:5969 length:1749 start_codon:yes stop_codon:yes gene_type:complete
MEKKIPEIEAREILSEYEGYNNQILDWKKRQSRDRHYSVSRSQCDYILKYNKIEPKVARKYIEIAKSFGSKLQEDRVLMEPVEKIWVEKLLCESDKAYHIWGNITKELPSICMWIPKASVIPEEKTLNREIDYSPYNHRPPMDHQKEAIEKLLANNKYILADDMGLGKTTSTVIASIESKINKVLIVCPASLKINWKREIELYSDEEVIIVEGKKWGSTAKYYIINYDILKNFHTTEKTEDSDAYKIILQEEFDLAIVDEAHYISNPQAQRTKLLNDILAKISKVWLLTGTPMTSRPINYYNLLKIVNSPLTLNWKSYVLRYCKGYQFRVGGRKIWNTSGASNLDELRDQTKSIVLRRLKTDILDLPEKIVSPIWLELKNSFYDDELTEFIRISEENKEKESITVTLNRLMKLRQLIAIEKVDHTCEIIDNVLEQGKKVIVFTNFTMSLDMIHEKYKKKSVVLDGRMSKEKRQISVDRFQNDDKVRIFIGNIKAAGVGITLTSADTVIMNDLSFVPADHSQAEDRAYRYGQKNSVLVYYPVFENTIEKTIYNILQKKKDIIDQVMGDGEYSESFGKELVRSI